MNEVKRIPKLSEGEIADLQRMARSKLGECRKTQDVIGNQIFSILGLYARVFYYPLGEKEPWGLTYMWGTDSAYSDEKPFVAINTSIPIDAQVFAAAHELYHIWFDQRSEAIPSSILYDSGESDHEIDDPELRANRFAAEFLVDEDLLRQEMKIYSITPGKIRVKDVLTLASLFTVPYKTMIKRLCEIGAMNKFEMDDFLSKSEDILTSLRTRFALPTLPTDNRVLIDNLVELAVSAYEQKKISYEKLQYVLSISNLEPKDVGIEEPITIMPPSDELLDSIMEE